MKERDGGKGGTDQLKRRKSMVEFSGTKSLRDLILRTI